jgi:hypothetical protein
MSFHNRLKNVLSERKIIAKDLRKVASLEVLLSKYDDLMFKHDELWNKYTLCEQGCEVLLDEIESIENSMENLRSTAKEEWNFTDLENGVKDLFRSHNSDEENN